MWYKFQTKHIVSGELNSTMKIFEQQRYLVHSIVLVAIKISPKFSIIILSRTQLQNIFRIFNVNSCCANTDPHWHTKKQPWKVNSIAIIGTEKHFLAEKTLSFAIEINIVKLTDDHTFNNLIATRIVLILYHSDTLCTQITSSDYFVFGQMKLIGDVISLFVENSVA